MRAFWTSLAFVFLAKGVFAIEALPPMTAKSVLVMDERSGKILFEKAAGVKRFPASTTKIMTALLLLEHCTPDELIYAPKDVENVPPSSMHLMPGEAVSASDMLHALLIRSANDGAYAVAMHIGGSVSNFAKMMNARAKAMGCTGTHFKNPHGLKDPGHTTTARDLAIIAREAMKNPVFRDAANTRSFVISRTINQDDLWMVTKNKILKYDPTADGIKTGYTAPAGYCYVGSATRNGSRFITVILGSKRDWPTEQKALMSWAFRNFKRSCLEEPGQIEHEVPVLGAYAETVKAVVREPVFYAHPKNVLPSVSLSVVPKSDLQLPISEGTEVGKAIFTDGKGWKFETPLYAAQGATSRRSISAAALASTGPASAIFLCALGGGALWMRRKSRAIFAS